LAGKNLPTLPSPNLSKRERTEDMKIKGYLFLIPVTGLLILTSCESTPQMTNRPDFLSTYTHLQKVDATTYRYVSPPLLANCNKFIVSPVKVLFHDYNNYSISAEERQHAADFVRQAFINALSQKYPVVSDTGPDVAEVRVAITEAYRTGGKRGLCVQGEILDNSNTQVAAVVRTELNEMYTQSWQDKPAARKMVEEWSQRLVKVIDEAKGK
jgi:hypothetical protein